jgi:hypothetical protein
MEIKIREGFLKEMVKICGIFKGFVKFGESGAQCAQS